MRDLHNRLDLCSINTATLGYQAPISNTIDAIARAGFGALALWRREVDDGTAPTIARQIRAHGLSVSGYCRSTYLPASSPDAFLANITDNRRALDQAAELRAACFVMVVGGLPSGSKDLPLARTQVAEGIAALLEDAKARGVALALEPLHPMYAADRSCLSTLEQALNLCDLVDPEATGIIGVAVDVYHCWWDPKLEEGIRRAGEKSRLLAFHVCDCLVPTRDMLLDRGMMGDGVIELRRIRSLMEAAGYVGPVEVEIFSQENWWRRPMHETLAVCAERLQLLC
jgi:sugar phosphate isomerase/epimerase